MRVIIQRVKKASCIVEGKIIADIASGMMLLVGFTHTDTIGQIDKMVQKIVNLRIFEDEQHKMNRSIQDIQGEILSISQFTLYANPYSGNRPSFIEAMRPEQASGLYQMWNEKLSRAFGKPVSTGEFGADMQLEVFCDGPVTITLEF
ncbi:MAG: D-aminoacyl-tRNA deacylase [Prevotella sp.]|nr:D-aminoacyl-tRNA deacylase [Staphylococcus sp.]MCM1349618.1 D-aminoacyl-tRNA deacylase [Prevotella sp.]